MRKDMSVTVDTLKTGNFTMDYCTFGSGKRTLVIIPGLSVQSVMPSAQDIAGAYRLLTDDYTVYVFDRRKDPPESYSIADMARDTAEAIRKLGRDDVDIFGASQGGMIAMEIALQQPDLVHSLILGSTTSCISRSRFDAIDSWIDMAKAGESEKLYLAFGELLYPPAVFEGAREQLIKSASTVTAEDLGRFVIMACALKGFDITSRLSAIVCPVLILGSEDDKVVGSEASRDIRKALTSCQHCELHMYNGYGHAVYDLAPDYSQRMLNFLKSIR